MLSDITSLIDSQIEREKALQIAQEANQVKNRFFSMASHEFRTPLAVIRSSAEMLRKYHDRLGHQQRERRLINIDAQITRLSSMLDDVLLLGKLESDNIILSRVSIEFSPWLQELLQEFRVAYPGYKLETQIPQDVTIYADKIFLRQIISNLLSNAVKYSDSSRIIQLLVELPEQQFELHVRDYGIGIPAEDIERLFKDFQRASNVGNIQGTGLGLSIVERAVKLHGGQISVLSTLGEGTTFTVRMPILR
jgi:signal transduction histidine kinase